MSLQMDPVLDGVGDQQEHDQVERVRLTELPLADDPKRDDQEDVDEKRAHDLLADAELEIGG